MGALTSTTSCWSKGPRCRTSGDAQDRPLGLSGGSDTFLGPREDIPLADPSWGCDFEAEIAVVMDDTPQGVEAHEVEQYIRLVMLCNDVSLRNLIPGELAKGFGFFTSKPSSAFSPSPSAPTSLATRGRVGASICRSSPTSMARSLAIQMPALRCASASTTSSRTCARRAR